ncbi:DUF1295 domain-containing protein [Fodinicola feengrottensis]|uniref:DUF1295 domain-containing protein n=1 Tax=Fodinicola feengrottensis TaxID=435914 RepID=UPI002442E609|nr:DUF1295 domain-containing protein [Fodinicola feengrottensis]
MSFALGSFLHTLPLTALAVVVLLAITFAAALIYHKHAVIDVAWGLGFALIAIVTLVASAGHGDPARRWLITALTVLWGVRLAVHIGWRGRRHGEDPPATTSFCRGRKATATRTHCAASIWCKASPCGSCRCPSK